MSTDPQRDPSQPVKLTVTMEYTYDTDAADYPNREPVLMAEYDLEVDPAVVFSGVWTITGAKAERR